MAERQPRIWTASEDDRAVATVICVLAEWIDAIGLEINGDGEYCPAPIILPFAQGFGRAPGNREDLDDSGIEVSGQ